MKVKTNLKAEGFNLNHNETLVRERAKGLKVKTHLKAGVLQLASSSLMQNLFTPLTSWERFAGSLPNHNETLVRDKAKGLKVKTHLKAGAVLMPQLPNACAR